MIPNFFIVGAARSGTTALYHILDEHPDVYMSPIKEPSVFAPEVINLSFYTRHAFEADKDALAEYLKNGPREKRRSGIVLDWSDYLKLFAYVRSEHAIGEASVVYLTIESAAAAIRKSIPDAKIVMLLRDPTERLFSQYIATRQVGNTDKLFVPWVEQERAAEVDRRPSFGAVWTGRYATHFNRYRDMFPADQIRVYLYDDFVRDPRAVVSNLLEFLGVDPNVALDMHQRHNETMVPRWSVPVMRRWFRRPYSQRPSQAERAHVVGVYEDEIRGLEQMLQCDLSHWLQ